MPCMGSWKEEIKTIAYHPVYVEGQGG